MKITLSGIIHIIISVIILIYAYMHQNPIILALSLSLMLVVYYEYKSFKEMLKSVENLYVQRKVDRKISNELDEVVMRIIIENKTDFVFPRVILKDLLPPLVFSNPSKPIFNLIIPARGSIAIEYKVKPLAPGVHDFQAFDLIVLDVLGYFYEIISMESRDSLVVLPLYSSTAIDTKTMQKIIGISLRGKAVSGMYDLANIREYTAGDDVRKILWKIYAKTTKLMVREDFGETRAKLLVLIDMRKNLWNIGIPPNTLAQIQLRYARSIIEYLVKNKCIVDVALCSGLVPKVVRNFEKNIEESLYNIMSVLPVGSGCESPLSVFTDSIYHLGREPEFYDAVILVTNPISLSTESIDSINMLLKMFLNKLIIIVPKYKYNEVVEEELLNNFLKSVAIFVEKYGADLEISDEEITIVYGR